MRVENRAVNGMTDYLTCERKRVPEEVVVKLNVWNCWFFRVTTRISKPTNLRGWKAIPALWAAVGFPVCYSALNCERAYNEDRRAADW